jgi:GntR family transcriptional repressor for pyruvate dehydrogenase complex
VIREALRTVSAKGLIRIEKGRGIFVKDLSADTVSDPLHQYLKFKIERNYALDVIHARQIIEPSIAAFAAVNRNDEDMEKLHDNILRLRNYSGEHSGLAALDMEFHMQIAYASHNQVIPLILDPIHRLMPEIKKSVYAANEHAQDSAIEWHSKIVDEIVRGNAEGSREMMKKHLEIAEEHIRIMLRAQSINSDKR